MPSFTFTPPATPALRAKQLLDLVPERWEQVEPEIAQAVRSGAELDMEAVCTVADLCDVSASYIACLPGCDLPFGVALKLEGWSESAGVADTGPMVSWH